MPKRSVVAAPNTTLELSIIVIKLSIIVLNKIPIFLKIFVASAAYFCINKTYPLHCLLTHQTIKIINHYPLSRNGGSPRSKTHEVPDRRKTVLWRRKPLTNEGFKRGPRKIFDFWGALWARVKRRNGSRLKSLSDFFATSQFRRYGRINYLSRACG